MPLNWVNIRSNEKTTTGDGPESEPQIAALWSSSDHSPNITQGQDFGWRLAPEVVVEMKKIKQDLSMLERIAQRFGKTLEDVGEIDILHYISNKTTLEAAPEVNVADYQDEYDAQIRALEGKPPTAEETLANISAMSDDELAAELARRQAATAPSTTTTTTEAPSTTTTTTEKA